MKTPEKKTILLVEDEAVIAMAEREVLSRFGYDVVIAPTGLQAVDLACANETVRLVLMDIDLGKGIDGTEAARRILSRRSVPIVFLTSHGEREMVEMVRGITRYGYVIKDSGDFVLKTSLEMAFELFETNVSLAEKMFDLDRSRAEAEKYLNVAASIIMSLDRDGRITLLNDSGHRLLGYPQGYLIGRDWFDLCLPEDNRAATRHVFHRLLEGSTAETHNHENAVVTKSGDIRNIQWHNTPLCDHTGAIVGTLSSGEDVTDNKRADEQLRRSEAELRETSDRLRSILQTAIDGFITVDMDGHILDVNATYCAISGYERNELLAMSLADFEADESTMDIRQRLAWIKAKGEARFENRHRRKDGSIIEVEVGVKYRPTEPECIVGFVKDITKRKRAEQELTHERQRLGNIIESTRVGTWEWDVQSGKTVFNERWASMIGFTLEELSPVNITTWSTLTHPDDLRHSEKLLEQHFRGELPYYECECRMRHKDGHWVWVQDRGKLISRTPQGAPLMMFGTHTDITERKKAEEETAQTGERFRRLLQSATAVAVQGYDASGIIQYWNDASVRLYGYSSSEAVGKSMLELIIPPAMHAEVRSVIAGMVKTGAPAPPSEYTLVGKNGNTVVVYTSHAVVRIPGRPTELFALDIDMNDRRHALASLRESEEKYRGLVEGSPDAIAIYVDGRVVYANDASLVLMRASHPEQLLGKPVIEFVHPDSRAFVARRMMEAAASGGPIPLAEEMFIRLDGTAVPVEVKAIPITLEGKPAVQLIVRDSTERKRSEENIQKLLKEKELILREVHHRIKNNMAVVKSLLSLQAASIKEPSASAALNDAVRRIQSMMVLYDRLFRAESFLEAPVDEYFSSLLDEIVAHFPINESLRIEKRLPPVILDAKRLSTLGLIVNELVTNSLKYAFGGATGGWLCVSVAQEDGSLAVSVADDGRGLPASVDGGSTVGFGIQLVNLLTEQLGGTLNLERDNGTKWTVKFPL